MRTTLLCLLVAWPALIIAEDAPRTKRSIDRHITVYGAEGEFAGWPANHGLWTWGDEVLVGFSIGFHKDLGTERHNIDRERPEQHVLGRSLDGGASWSIEYPNAKGMLINAGGMLGGISTGQPIVMRLAIKPTSSIGKPQATIDIHGADRTIQVKGRHDPCLCPRIGPVAEAMTAPVFPVDTTASASPFLTSLWATTRDEPFFLIPSAGDASIEITSSAFTTETLSIGAFRSFRILSRVSFGPTNAMPVLLDPFPFRYSSAPCTITPGPRSPPMVSTAILIDMIQLQPIMTTSG